MSGMRFIGEDGTFVLERPENINGLYFPLAGEGGLKSCVTPNLGGDAKLDQESFLLQPVSVDDLHNNRSTRNFWVTTEDGAHWSATGASAEAECQRYTDNQDASRVTAGFMWHTLTRRSDALGLEAEITSFVPLRERAEILWVRLRNVGSAPRRLTATAAVPIYGRSADNLRDHRNVTSMLHRIRTVENGVVVTPTMSFDERGHRLNHRSYYVMGTTGGGSAPAEFFPTVDEFLGLGGTFTRPEAVILGDSGVPAGTERAGREAMGALRFEPVELAPGGGAEYIVLLGIADSDGELERTAKAFDTSQKVAAALDDVKRHWQEAVNVACHTADPDFDRLMRWVSFQPFLRRIFGCSFLPHHDYGRGGRGWRDLWQDCLSLLIMDPSGVRRMIVENFGGVRIDGTNATIIGSGRGEFIADRNGIARVWMDHALWPWMTVQLYLDQTGDDGVLDESAPYFKDAQARRGRDIDDAWDDAYGMRLRDASGNVYMGTVLEHLLVEHLPGFYEVGAHNNYLLRGADWNDALDMAPNRGESVAFTCAYAGNLRGIAELLDRLAGKGREKLSLPAEFAPLIGGSAALYDSVEAKGRVLDDFARSCAHCLSGGRIEVDLRALAADLRGKADWIVAHVRAREWIEDGEDGGWFNSYYDDHSRPVEGLRPDGDRMMLTGQVFAVMSGTATDEQTARICRSADRRLYDPAIGGYRINTDFRELKGDMGRMFGFAYGEKENGSVFSHMATMYANALYRRGFARQGWKAMKALSDAALRFDRSRIYPGIPEYFNNDGRGLYHYLTGSASWYMLTLVTEVFGVRGADGDLKIAPRLVREQFDAEGRASLRLRFAGADLRIEFVNPEGLDAGEYRITGVSGALGGAEGLPASEAVIPRERITALGAGTHCVRIELG